uniref:Transthyretin-like family protein n=1 Tax=Elaeophora elaphi TaxID=1147741 RepID=A0A0R3RLY5_9BILA
MFILFLLAVSFYIANGFRTQSAGVRGILMCGDLPLANTKVKLWDEDATDMDDLLQEGTTNAHGYFELSGHTSEITTINPILKIYHDCNDGIMETFEIPQEYVSNGEDVEKFFDIGTVNMQIIFPDQSRDCIHRY